MTSNSEARSKFGNTSDLLNNHNDSSAENASLYESDEPAPGSSGMLQTFLSCFAGVVMILALSINGLCLTAFYRENSLRTPFNCMLINLTLTEFCYALSSIPNFIILNYFGYWPLGKDYCTLYLWTEWIFSAAVQNNIMLIGWERVWALCRPLHYRQHRGSYRTTGYAIGGMWLWLLACIGPGIISNRITNSDTRRCEVIMDSRLKQIWGLFVTFANYILPELLLLVSLGLTAFKLRQQTKRRMNMIQPAYTEVLAIRLLKRIPGGIPTHTPSKRSHLYVPQTATVNTLHPPKQMLTDRITKDRQLFTLFMCLGVSMFVLWLPGDIFWTLYNLDPDNYNFSAAMTVCLLMYVSIVINPLFYQIGNKELRLVVLKLLCKPFSKGGAIHHERTASSSTTGKNDVPLQIVTISDAAV